MKYIFIALFLVAGFVRWPANAQMQLPLQETMIINCANGPKLIDALRTGWAEQPSYGGPLGGKNGAYLVVYRTKSGSSWSILLLRTTGQACMLASGKNWTDFGSSHIKSEDRKGIGEK